MTQLWENGKVFFLKRIKPKSSHSNLLKSNTTVNEGFQGQFLLHLTSFYFPPPSCCSQNAGEIIFFIQNFSYWGFMSWVSTRMQFPKSKEVMGFKRPCVWRARNGIRVPLVTQRQSRDSGSVKSIFNICLLLSLDCTFQGMINSTC